MSSAIALFFPVLVEVVCVDQERARKTGGRVLNVGVRRGVPEGKGGGRTRHATSVRQGNWFSVVIGPGSKATQ